MITMYAFQRVEATPTAKINVAGSHRMPALRSAAGSAELDKTNDSVRPRLTTGRGVDAAITIAMCRSRH